MMMMMTMMAALVVMSFRGSFLFVMLVHHTS
jgi:hypothetical protein